MLRDYDRRPGYLKSLTGRTNNVPDTPGPRYRRPPLPSQSVPEQLHPVRRLLVGSTSSVAIRPGRSRLGVLMSTVGEGRFGAMTWA